MEFLFTQKTRYPPMRAIILICVLVLSFGFYGCDEPKDETKSDFDLLMDYLNTFESFTSITGYAVYHKENLIEAEADAYNNKVTSLATSAGFLFGSSVVRTVPVYYEDDFIWAYKANRYNVIYLLDSDYREISFLTIEDNEYGYNIYTEKVGVR